MGNIGFSVGEGAEDAEDGEEWCGHGGKIRRPPGRGTCLDGTFGRVRLTPGAWLDPDPSNAFVFAHGLRFCPPFWTASRLSCARATFVTCTTYLLRLRFGSRLGRYMPSPDGPGVNDIARAIAHHGDWRTHCGAHRTIVEWEYEMPDSKEERTWYSDPRDLPEAEAKVKEVAYGYMGLGVIQGVFGMFLSPLILVDAAVFGLGGFWLLRSRRVSVAGVLAVVAAASVVATVANKLGAGLPGGTNVFLIPFLVIMGLQGIRGAIAYHRFAAEDPDYQRPARWPTAVLASLVVAFGGLVAYGYSLPDVVDVLVPGSSLSDEVHTFLSAELIAPNEQVVYFYAPTPNDFQETGTVMTVRRVISYAVVDGELLSRSYYFDEISDFRVDQEGTNWDVTYVEIDGDDGGALLIGLPSMEPDARPFMDELRVRTRDAYR
jgi:protein-S-isoprenylcysteine O-methyltransferase Ste14